MKKSDTKQIRRDVNIELDQLESELNELKIRYEQYFSGIIPREPTDIRDEAVRNLRKLRNAPFHNSQTLFRLRTLDSRYQTFKTYWERVNRDRENGKYSRDVFKSELREKNTQPIEKRRELITESTLMRLFHTYQTALKRTGVNPDKADFSAFKKSLLEKAKTQAEKNPGGKIAYKVGIKNGKVVVVGKNE